MRFKKIFFCVSWVFIFSFLLNFFWESIHGYSLYRDHIIDADQYVPMMHYVSLMDAAVILGIYFFISLLEKDILWLKELDRRKILWILSLGLIVAIVAEYRAVYWVEEWKYNSQMPVIFGIGLSPLVQLSVTGLVSIWLTKRLFYPKHKLEA